jgi:transcriptional regulator with XRE-family HTH domain
MVVEVGQLVAERVKAARLARNLTTRDLARASDLALNTISLIERGKISPTIATLHKLASALEVPLAYFVQDNEVQDVVYLRQGRRRQTRSGWVLLENLGSGLANQTIEPLLLTLEPGASSGAEPIVHSGHELVFCLDGLIEYQVRDTVYRMEPEDSLLFEAHLPHSWRNPLPSVSRLLLIIESERGGSHEH